MAESLSMNHRLRIVDLAAGVSRVAAGPSNRGSATIMVVLGIVLIAVLFGCLVSLHAVQSAPVGWEDDHGFHRSDTNISEGQV
jgi:hypothetical protein